MGIINLIESIIINLFSSQLYDGKMTFCERIRLKYFRKKLLKWIRKYIIQHDGTVLTTGDFEIFLQYHQPIENIFKQISSGTGVVSKEMFINEQVELFYRVQNHKEKNGSDTGDILKGFFMHVYDEIDLFFVKNLSQNEKYIIARTNMGNQQIIDTLKKSKKEIHNDLTDIKKVLQENLQICDPELVWSIYQSISSLILNGKISEVLQIYPLLMGKSKDLESSISYLLSLFSDNNSFYTDFCTIQNDIIDNRIYDHICRISIYINKWRNKNVNLNKVSSRNLDLKHIVQSLLDGKQDDFYTIEKSEKDGITCFMYNVGNNYPNEQWLVNRICLLDIVKQPLFNIPENIKQLIEDSNNIVDKLIFLETRITELYNRLEIDSKLANELYNDAYELVKISEYLAKDIKVIIYEMLLRSARIVSIEQAEKASEMIPKNLQEVKNIQFLLIQVKIEKNTIDCDEVINICMKHGEYWLFSNYLIEHVDNHPLEMKRLIEKYKFIIELEPHVFLIYVYLVNKLDGQRMALELFNEYKKKYGEFVEFWINKLRIKFIDEEFDIMITEYKKGNLKYLTNEGSVELVKFLIQNKLYENALEIINKHEITGNIRHDFFRLKAIALYNTNHEIESLSVFTKLFEDGNHSEGIVYYILALSCNNRREVPFEVLMCAEQSENPQILMLAANVFVIENNVEKAFKMNLKAMLRTTDYQSDVFNQYIGIEISENQFEKTIINSTDIDTVVQLLDLNDETKKSMYAIHSLDLLPEEPYVWGNAIHIYKETAIMYGLLRKKKGDIVVIDSHSYKIEEILPLKAYFFRFSMEKVVANGKAKMVSVPTTKNDRIDVQKFVQVLKEEIGDNENQYVWLEQYKDLNKLPVPFFFCKNFVRATYFQLVSLMLVDKTILYRESVDNIPQQYGNYIFSYAALVILYKLGWSYSSDKSKYAIPSTMKKEIFAEVEEIIRENTKDHVTFMEVRNEQLYFVESTENEKDQSMKEAVEFKRYSEKYTTLDNDSDLHLDNDSHSIIKEMLGISDYDSIIIAKNNGRILVTAEEIVSRICHMPEINVPTNGIANFLAKETNDIDKLLMYVRKMVEYKCTVPFTIHTINRILDFFEEANQEEKKSIIEQWSEILQLPIEDEQYKSVMIACIQNCLAYLNSEEDRLTPIGKSLLFFWLKYTRQKILVNRNENGEFITQIVKEE